jgi:hypothetical protein
MENDGPVVGLDAPTAESNMIKRVNRDRGLKAANFLVARDALVTVPIADLRRTPENHSGRDS